MTEAALKVWVAIAVIRMNEVGLHVNDI